MFQTYSFKEKIKLLVQIFFPILLAQLFIFATHFFDTLMAGRVTPADLAGVAIGLSLWTPFLTGLTGVLAAVTPIVSHMLGAQESKEKIRKFIYQTIYVAVVMSVICLIFVFVVLEQVLQLIHVEEQVREISQQFLKFLSIGFIPVFLYATVRCFIDAHGKTWITMMISITALPVNILLNYLFIYGKLGFPKLGGAGTGIASGITCWYMLFVGLLVISRLKPFKTFRLLSHLYKPDLKEWKQLFRIGTPIGLAIFFEVSIFSAVTLLMSNFTTNTIAAHQSAINFSSLLYSFPLAISMALTICVGYEVGAKRYHDAKQFVKIGVATSTSFALIAAVFLFFYRDTIASLYTNNLEVLNLTSYFLIFAIFFQLSDAVQAPIQGALRGYHDVKFALYMTLIGYWLVGLPIGYYCGTYTQLGAAGYWIGFIVGLAICAIGVSWRLNYVQKQMSADPLF